MAYRVIDPFAQFLTNAGRLNAGGSITTYLTDLTTLAPTYTDDTLTTSNGSTVTLDAYGRPLVDMWSEVPLGIVIKDSLGVTIKTRNNVPGYGASDQVLPTDGDPDDFLQWDGTEYILAPIRQVPDPTGLNGYYLGSDGTGVPVWIQFPETETPTPEYDVETGFIRIGTLLIQWGTGTVPAASGAQTANVAITFGEAFSATPYAVIPTLSNSGGSTASGRFAALAATSLSTTGATITANVGEDDTRSDFKLTNSTPFTYVAIGPTTLPDA